MKKITYVLAPIALLINLSIYAQSFSTNFDMQGAWSQNINTPNATASALQLKSGDIIKFTAPKGVYVNGTWGTVAATKCTKQDTATQTLSTCTISGIGTYTKTLSATINVETAAEIHTTGQIIISRNTPLQSGTLSITAHATPATTAKAPYTLKDKTGHTVAFGRLDWAHPTLNKALNSQEGANNYTLDTPSFISNNQSYTATSGAQSITIHKDKTTMANVNYKASALPNETIKINVSNFPAGQSGTLTFSDGTPADSHTIPITKNGVATTQVVQNQQTWTVYGAAIDDKFFADITPSSFVANKASQVLDLDYQKTPTLSFIYSPYKDVGINMNWNTYRIGTTLNGGQQDLVDALPKANKTVTLAFATGKCGTENWANVAADTFAKANIPLLKKHNINYIISTGGQAGALTCDSASGMETFLNRYASKNMVGLDLDIENSLYTPDVLTKLMNTTAAVQKKQNLHVILTLATLAGDDGSTLNQTGVNALSAAKAAGLKFNVNLMVMDYGSADPNICKIGPNKQCDMGASAINAAKNFSKHYDIPLNRVELTPMIGDNDVQGENFTLKDAAQVAQFVKTNKLAGLHYWSFDRDIPCSKTKIQSKLLGASATCNNQSKERAFEFDDAFLSRLN